MAVTQHLHYRMYLPDPIVIHMQEECRNNNYCTLIREASFTVRKIMKVLTKPYKERFTAHRYRQVPAPCSRTEHLPYRQSPRRPTLVAIEHRMPVTTSLQSQGGAPH